MTTGKVTIKNYRGFADEEPVSFEFGHGFTALLGKNNSGKSSAKLLFYELRPLFQALQALGPGQFPGFIHLLAGNQMDVPYPGVTDPEELFNNTNKRPISIEIEVVETTVAARRPRVIRKVKLTADRKNPRLWSMAAFDQRDEQVLHPPQGFQVPELGTLQSRDNQPEIDLGPIGELMTALVGARYYGPFRNAINVGGTDHFDLKTGTGFIDLWDGWKTSGIKAQTRAIGQVTEDIRRLFEFDQLEINASKPLHTLMVTINGQPYRLAELGSGLAQFIMVLGNAATTNPTIVFIDEPETNLHPSLQIDFLLALAQYATVGCVFSTHSIGLARSVARRIYSFQKGDRGTLVRPFEATPNYVEFLGELSFSAFKEMGHDRLLLVEGVNDVKAVQQLLRLVGKEHKTVLLPLGGNQLAAGGRELELSELTRLSSNICAIVDSERTAEEQPPVERRREFADTCQKLGITVCVTQRRAIENYFTDRAIKAGLGASFASLGPYETLKDASNAWRKSDNWKIARQMTVDELAGTDLGAFITSI